MRLPSKNLILCFGRCHLRVCPGNKLWHSAVVQPAEHHQGKGQGAGCSQERGHNAEVNSQQLSEVIIGMLVA